jgi:hypothetical protein
LHFTLFKTSIAFLPSAPAMRCNLFFGKKSLKKGFSLLSGLENLNN